LRFRQDENQCAATTQIVGVTAARVRYWRKTGVAPHATLAGQRRLYDFRDLVGFKVLARLRGTLSLQALRKLGEWLGVSHEAPWATLKFYVVGKDVFFSDPATGQMTALKPLGQRVFSELILLEEIARETRSEVIAIRRRKPEQLGKIGRHRDVHSNRPVVEGTRIPTSTIWSFHKAGYSVEDILREYPSLTVDDIRAALKYERRDAA
jgi:uncharacterized protein (DUF433 family)